MVSSINPLTQLVATLTARLAERPRSGETGPARRRGARTAPASATLDEIIGRRVAAIDPDDPRRGQRAFQVFLEAVLLAQFGEEFMNESRFHQLVQDVDQALRDDPATRVMVDDAIARLLDHPTQR